MVGYGRCETPVPVFLSFFVLLSLLSLSNDCSLPRSVMKNGKRWGARVLSLSTEKNDDRGRTVVVRSRSSGKMKNPKYVFLE